MIENFRELYKYRTLIYALVSRHLSMRYRGSLLGFLWSFLNPLLLMLVYSLVFKYYIRFDQVDNYSIFMFCGLLPWIWLSSGLVEGTNAIVSSGHLITKSMFPAQILPVVAVLTSLVHFLLSLPLLLIFMFVFGVSIKWTLLLLPLVIALQTFLLIGSSLLLGSLNVYYRDIQHILNNLLTFLFFLCPIIYPASVVPEKLKFTITFNPLAALTEIYHNLILDGVIPSLFSVVYLTVFVIIVLWLGSLVYNHYRESFAELL